MHALSASTPQGSRDGLSEVAVRNKAGAFVTAHSLDIENTISAIADVLPQEFDGDFSGIQDKTFDMPGDGVSEFKLGITKHFASPYHLF